MQEERYLRLSRFSVEDCVDIVALRLDGLAATWANAQLLEVSKRKRMPYIWDEFHTHMIAHFESITDNEEVRRELREVCQTRRVASYRAKFSGTKKQAPHHD